MGDSLPVVDLGSNTVQEVAAGQSHTCVLLTSGDVACWGYNEYGQASLCRQVFFHTALAVRFFLLFGQAALQGKQVYLNLWHLIVRFMVGGNRHAHTRVVPNHRRAMIDEIEGEVAVRATSANRHGLCTLYRLAQAEGTAVVKTVVGVAGDAKRVDTSIPIQ